VACKKGGTYLNSKKVCASGRRVLYLFLERSKERKGRREGGGSESDIERLLFCDQLEPI
jgi:hypothetical protein